MSAMEMSDLPESILARIAQQEAEPPIETVREFLSGYVADADNLGEIRTHLAQIARVRTRMHHRVLSAIDDVLAGSWPEGTLAHLVGWDGNWVLDDRSDAGAALFLRELAGMLRSVIAEGDSSGR